MTDWVQLIVDVSRPGDDIVAGDLWSVGVGGIEERTVEGDGGAVCLVVGLEAAALPDALAVLDRHGLVPEVLEVAVDEGLDGWRDFAVPHVVGSMAIVPAWWDEPVSALAAGGSSGARLVELRLDAGRAFGHGGHVTTRLALQAMQQIDLVAATALDVGCGSGVLSIAAALLGASRVVAVDLASEAVEATRTNAARNDVSSVVDVRAGSVAAAADLPAVDVVVANIEAPALVGIAPEVVRIVRPGTRVVLSGYLTSQADRVIGAYGALDLESRIDEGEWSAAVLRRGFA